MAKIKKLFKIILSIKFKFSKPLKKKILIYDEYSIKFSKVLFKKKNYEILRTRFEEINLFILIKTIFKHGFVNLIFNYDKLSRNECEYRNMLKRALDDLLSEIVATGKYETLKDNRTFAAPTKSINDLIEEICFIQANSVKQELVERLERGAV
jgi:hypothetical protein